MLAGMDQVAGPQLAAAVCNAGGFGTLGGARYTPAMLREMIAELKGALDDEEAPFGVDLLIPQVGGSARKTNVSLVFCLLFFVPFFPSIFREREREMMMMCIYGRSLKRRAKEL